MIRLIPVTEDNWTEIASLSVKEHQRNYVAPAVGILARGYVYRGCNAKVYAFDEDGTIVGMALVREFTDDPPGYDLQQFMIDRRYQNRGYGSKALQLILDELRKEGRHDHVELCVKKADAEAIRLYEKYGFADSGYVDEALPDSLNMICRFQDPEPKNGVRLERMDDFFADRVDGYDEHMKTNIEGASGFYAYTASLLPEAAGARVLDLGCGTGLELEEYFALNPLARVTGIDLSDAMLNAMKAKFPGKALTLVQASYFDEPLGENCYDAAVSVESLHHFPAEMKESLYRKLHTALKEDGVFVLTDYFAESDEMEKEYFRNLAELKKEQGIADDAFYHYDTPLTPEHETEILRRAGFRDVRMMKKWGESTFTVLAKA